MNKVKSYLESILIARKMLAERNKVYYKNSNKYSCVEEFVLAKGSLHQHKEIPDWIIKGETKECFQNCFNNLLKFPDLVYCEGFALCQTLPVHHAWLLDDDNKVIDPTWWSLPQQSVEYFGVSFRKQYVLQIAASSGYYGVIDNFVEGYPLLTGDHTPDQYLIELAAH